MTTGSITKIPIKSAELLTLELVRGKRQQQQLKQSNNIVCESIVNLKVMQALPVSSYNNVMKKQVITRPVIFMNEEGGLEQQQYMTLRKCSTSEWRFCIESSKIY